MKEKYVDIEVDHFKYRLSTVTNVAYIRVKNSFDEEYWKGIQPTTHAADYGNIVKFLATKLVELTK